MHGRVEAQVYLESLRTQHVFIQVDDRLVDTVQDRHRVGTVVTLYRDVVSGIAIAQRKAVLPARNDIDIGDFA